MIIPIENKKEKKEGEKKIIHDFIV